MVLKFRYKAKEEVSAEALALYTERDAAFVLDVEGTVDKARRRKPKGETLGHCLL